MKTAPAKKSRGKSKKINNSESWFLIKPLLKQNNELCFVPSSVLDSLSASEIYSLGIAAYVEQRRQLMQDALFGDHYLNGIKIVDGLELSLKKIEEKLPDLITQIESNLGLGIKSGKC